MSELKDEPITLTGLFAVNERIEAVERTTARLTRTMQELVDCDRELAMRFTALWQDVSLVNHWMQENDRELREMREGMAAWQELKAAFESMEMP